MRESRNPPGLVLLLLLCRGDATNGTGHGEWLYAAADGSVPSKVIQAQTWDYQECTHDHTQSPINIVTAGALPDAALVDAIEPSINANYARPTTTKHGFQLFHTSPNLSAHERLRSAEGGGAGRSTGRSTAAGKGSTRLMGEPYNFYQIHWHVPSENTLDGQHTAMEAHLVHQIAEPEYVGSNSHLAVVAILYELSERCNAELDVFWPLFPQEVASAAPNVTMVDVQAMLERLLPGGFYHYLGSLTTPPCTPGVSWYVLKRKAVVCQRQIDRLSSVLAALQRGVGINNRATQPLHQRKVTMTPQTAEDACIGGLVCSPVSTVLLLALLAAAASLGARTFRSRRSSRLAAQASPALRATETAEITEITEMQPRDAARCSLSSQVQPAPWS